MARQASVETRLRTALRAWKVASADSYEARKEAAGYRARATKAEQEVAEWKARFDALLARTPKLPDEEK
jgi:hypothetical protein